MSGENPPAFPVSSIDGFTQHGMDLRDWFAGQALAGLLSNETVGFGPTLQGSPTAIAEACHEYADAMLVERAKGGAAEAAAHQVQS